MPSLPLILSNQLNFLSLLSDTWEHGACRLAVHETLEDFLYHSLTQAIFYFILQSSVLMSCLLQLEESLFIVILPANQCVCGMGRRGEPTVCNNCAELNSWGMKLIMGSYFMLLFSMFKWTYYSLEFFSLDTSLRHQDFFPPENSMSSQPPLHSRVLLSTCLPFQSDLWSSTHLLTQCYWQSGKCQQGAF